MPCSFTLSRSTSTTSCGTLIWKPLKTPASFGFWYAFPMTAWVAW